MKKKNAEFSFLSFSKRQRRKGSALLAVFLFALFSYVILSTLLPSMVTEYKVSVRSRMMMIALASAEFGAEKALWALNSLNNEVEWENATDVANALDALEGTGNPDGEGWEVAHEDDGDAVLIRSYNISAGGDSIFTLDGGENAVIRVVIRPRSNGTTEIIADGTVSRGQGGTEISRLVIMQVDQWMPFAGLIAKESLTFNGQPNFDSYNSSEFPYYYATGKNSGEEVVVGSISSASGSVSLGNAHIYGDVVSGAEDPAASGAVSGGRTITGEVIGDYYMDMPDIDPPDTTGWNTSM